MDDASWDFRDLVETHGNADRSARARIRSLRDWILDDPGRPHDIQRLAERAAVSPRTLSRLFRRETGTSPAKFVARARLALARRLLERTSLRIEAIAARSGFGSGERMRRTFHRALEASPRAYASLGWGTMRR